MVMLTTGETAAGGVGLGVGEGLITAAVGPDVPDALGLTLATGGVPLEHATRPSATTITPAFTWPSTVRSRLSLPRMPALAPNPRTNFSRLPALANDGPHGEACLPHETRRGAALGPIYSGRHPSVNHQAPPSLVCGRRGSHGGGLPPP